MKTFEKLLWASLCFCFVCLGSSCLKDETEDLPTLLQTLQQQGHYTTFLSLVDDADLMAQLDGGLNMTIFPPTDAAFELYMRENGIVNMAALPQETRQNLLSYHLQVGSAAIENIITNFYTTPTNLGPDNTPLSVFIASNGIRAELNKKANVVQTNLKAKNGYIHGIDSVLVFPTAVDLLVAGGVHSKFLEGLEKAGLMGLLQGGEPHTLMAPTDEAFQVFFDITPGISSFDDMTPQRLREVMRYHLIRGNHRAETLPGGVLETLNDNETIEIIPFDNGININGFTNSIILNIQGTNGVAHIIDRVLVPD
ncbi:MAG: fasciclin domain-containing protein [Bacteroidetes bacterium]|nr:MAG: fasciclin domain-containing protein [Bacteroidota bacterium]